MTINTDIILNSNNSNSSTAASSLEVVIRRKLEQMDGRRSVVYLVRNNSEVREAQTLLRSTTDPTTFGDGNKVALWNAGNTPTSAVSALALFEAAKEKQNATIHLAAIFAGLSQLSGGGSLANMLVASRAAYQPYDTLYAQVQGFETAYKNASEDDRLSMNAYALYAALALISSSS